MTCNAQRDAKSGVEETRLVTRSINELLPELSEGNRMMVGMKIDTLALATACTAMLTGVFVALVYSVTPSDVRLGLAQNLLSLGYATLPVMGLLSTSLTGTFGLSDDELPTSQIMEREELGNAYAGTVHVRLDDDDTLASTVAKVLAPMGPHPKVYAAIVSAAMVAGVGIPLAGPAHNQASLYQVQHRLSSKWGELLEALTGDAEGNQQPSTVNGDVQVTVKVQRLAGEEPTDKPATSAPRESDDIVLAHSNVG